MEKTKLKNMLKLMTLGWGVSIIFILLVYVIGGLLYGENTMLGGFSIKLLIPLATLVVAIVDLFLIIVYLGTAGVDENEIIKTENYERDIPKEVPPAIASLLLDYIMDNEREYTATVASLIAKGYINIEDSRQARFFKWDKENLLEHEQVVFDALREDRKYDGEMFKTAVINDAVKLGFLRKKEKNHLYLIPIFALILIIEILKSNLQISTSLMPYFIYLGVVMLGVLFVIVMLFFSIIKQPNTIKGSYSRTVTGKENAIKLTGLKKFIHDYTLLSQRGLADTILYDDYIAYAVALGEADAIESYILNNPKYRNLVYRKTQISDDPIKRAY